MIAASLAQTLLALLAAAGGAAAASTDLYPMQLRAGIYRNQPHAYQDEDGAWKGLVFDLADVLAEKARADGIDLDIEIDTENGVLSDREGDAGTPDGTLAALAPDCGADDGNGFPCYDIVLGAYTRLPYRATRVVFNPPFSTTYMTTIKRKDGEINSIADLAASQQSICLWEGSSNYALLAPYVNDTSKINPCPNQTACYDALRNGECALLGEDYITAASRIENDTALVLTGEAVPETLNALSIPMRPTLDIPVQILLAKWTHDAYVEGDLEAMEDLVQYVVGDVEANGLAPLVVQSAVVRDKTHAHQDEEGAWVGYGFDLVESLVARATADGIDLQFDVDTTHGVLSDREGDAGTPDGTLDALAPECQSGCYDAILGPYTRTTARSTRTTFTPPFVATYMTTLRRKDGKYNSIDEANENDGTVCLWENSSVYYALAPYVDNIVGCPTQAECYEGLRDGGCDLMGEEAATASDQALSDDDLIHTLERVPNTLDPLSLPMKMTLDTATQILLTKWLHDANVDGELTAINDLLGYLAPASNGTDPPPADAPATAPNDDSSSKPTSSATLAALSLSSGVFGVFTTFFV